MPPLLHTQPSPNIPLLTITRLMAQRVYTHMINKIPRHISTCTHISRHLHIRYSYFVYQMIERTSTNKDCIVDIFFSDEHEFKQNRLVVDSVLPFYHALFVFLSMWKQSKHNSQSNWDTIVNQTIIVYLRLPIHEEVNTSLNVDNVREKIVHTHISMMRCSIGTTHSH